MTSAKHPSHWLVPAAEIVTVGLPFCAFKALTGLALITTTSLRPIGYALLALGAIDLLFNVANLATLVFARRRIGSVCLIELVTRYFDKREGHDDLGLALDLFLSFVLVAIVIGAGMLPKLPPHTLPLWNLAVVLNVLGAGCGRLFPVLNQRRTSRLEARSVRCVQDDVQSSDLSRARPDGEQRSGPQPAEKDAEE